MTAIEGSYDMTPNRNEMNRRLVDFAESPNCRFWQVDYDQLSVPERVFGVIWELEAEVYNGGFRQYFENASGRLAPDAVDALIAIGAAVAADIVARAIETIAENTPWSDDEAREAKLNRLSESANAALASLDEAFLQYPDDLATLLYAYVCGHRKELGAPDEFAGR